MIPYEQRSFYNTTSETGDTLKDYKEKARSQDMDVLKTFKTLDSSTLLTPELVLKLLQQSQPKRYANCPCTSIRRSFSNLSNEGLITRSGHMVKGNYGRRVNCYKVSQ